MGITTIVLDFGNVVGFFSHRRAAEQVAALASGREVPLAPLQADLFESPLAHQYDTGRISTAEFVADIRARHRLVCSDAAFARAFADIFTPNPDVCDLLPRLK